MNSAVKIMQPTHADLFEIAQCHRKAFPKTLSTAMGQGYVQKMLEWYLEDERAFLFFLEESGRCMGYCGGLLVDGKVAVGSASSMIQYSYNAAVRSILSRPWLLLHLEFIKKYRLALKNIWRRAKSNFGVPILTSTPSSEVAPHVGLIVIGVDPLFQGRGYGRMLLQEFERESVKRGYKYMMLTVRTDNVQAIRSYIQNGWCSTFVSANSTTMEKRLT